VFQAEAVWEEFDADSIIQGTPEAGLTLRHACQHKVRTRATLQKKAAFRLAKSSN
jgi:hypothetical protein